MKSENVERKMFTNHQTIFPASQAHVGEDVFFKRM